MSKSFSLFINFNGECREALAYYGGIFQAEATDIMTYSQIPPSDGYSPPESDKDRIMYASLPIFGTNVMFSDSPSDTPTIVGDNIAPTLSTDDKAELTRIFSALKDGGEVYMDLAPTFWSQLYGSVKDKYGVVWQLSHEG
ncbi:VOC family protein [Clostridia bacterium]|nr:VOC family protein [Clostridia bacterium]